MSQLVIIGNGVAGITTARHVRKMSDMPITVISGETEYFFSRTALMYIYMGHLTFEHTKPYEDWFWPRNRINLIQAWVKKVDTAAKKVILEDGRELSYARLLLATGSRPNKFGWPGQDLPGVQGLYSYQDLQMLEENSRRTRRAVIVGGGLIGIELAEMLLSRGIAVTFLVREKNYWDNVLPEEEARLIGRHIKEHGVDLRLATNLVEIIAGPDGRAAAVKTDKGETIPCQLVGLTAGVHPNINLARASGIPTGRGILVNEYLETEIPNIYAAGDCAEIVPEGQATGKVEQLWYTARMQGETVAQNICGRRQKYRRGIWFNSAKFFDIEYQTYGFVPNQPREGEDSFYWEHRDGRHAIRLVYRRVDGAVTGMNFFGIRMRQEVCQQWIAEKRPLEYVLTHLPLANFDPEFFRQFEPEILAELNRQTGKRLTLQAKRGKPIFLTEPSWKEVQA